MEHLFEVEEAEKVGINAAIISRYIKHFQPPMTSPYFTIHEIMDVFPFMSRYDVEKAVNTLAFAGIVVMANGTFSAKEVNQCK